MIGLLIGFKRYKWGGKMQKFLMIIVVELMSFLKKEKVTQLGPEFLFLFLFLFIYFFLNLEVEQHLGWI